MIHDARAMGTQNRSQRFIVLFLNKYFSYIVLNWNILLSFVRTIRRQNRTHDSCVLSSQDFLILLVLIYIYIILSAKNLTNHFLDDRVIFISSGGSRSVYICVRIASQIYSTLSRVCRPSTPAARASYTA